MDLRNVWEIVSFSFFSFFFCHRIYFPLFWRGDRKGAGDWGAPAWLWGVGDRVGPCAESRRCLICEGSGLGNKSLHKHTHNGLPDNVNGERLLETSQFTWWIGQIFLVTLYIESPLDRLLLASLSPATIFRFPIPLWLGARISPDRGRKSLAS